MAFDLAMIVTQYSTKQDCSHEILRAKKILKNRIILDDLRFFCGGSLTSGQLVKGSFQTGLEILLILVSMQKRNHR